MHFGVDLSSNNAHPLNVDAIAAYLRARGGGDQPFAIVKVNQGTGYVNEDARGDLAALAAAGFAEAGYLMDEGTASVAAEEALYKATVGALPQTDDDELPEGLSADEYRAHLEQLVQQNPTALDYLNQSEERDSYPQADGLWLAEYNGLPGTTSAPCLIHQFTSTLTIPGCEGTFDVNVWLGTEEQFDSFFGIAPPITTTTDTPGGSSMGTSATCVRPTALNSPDSIDRLAVVDGVPMWAGRTPYWKEAAWAKLTDRGAEPLPNGVTAVGVEAVWDPTQLSLLVIVTGSDGHFYLNVMQPNNDWHFGAWEVDNAVTVAVPG